MNWCGMGEWGVRLINWKFSGNLSGFLKDAEWIFKRFFFMLGRASGIANPMTQFWFQR